MATKQALVDKLAAGRKERNERKALGDRAAGIRRKKARGGSVTDAEEEFLDDWEATKDTRGRRSKVGAVPRSAPTPDDAPPAPASSPEPGEAPSIEPHVEPPPKVEVLPARPHARSGGNWRDKYRTAADSRESVCVEFATFGVGLAMVLHDSIKAMGGQPYISEEQIKGPLFGAAVLVVDEALPSSIELTPRGTLLAGFGMLGGQWAAMKFLQKRAAKNAPPSATDKPKPPPPQPKPEPKPAEAKSETTPEPKPPANGTGAADDLLRKKPDALF